jgi:hypothetical protein
VTAPRVDISNLSVADQLGLGGQGRVLAVPGFMINGQWPAALKIYNPAVAAGMDAAALETLVGLPQRVGGSEGEWLLEHTAWPAVIAQDRGTVCGFLMRAVPGEYYFSFQTQAHGARPRLAELAFLLNSDDYLISSGLAVSDWDRLMLLKSVAGALSRLHAVGAAAGDFSPKNVLFSLKPAPSCFLIDCDAVQLAGRSVFRQIETPDWEIPPGEPKATVASDAFKLGLLAIRLFARDQSTADPTALAVASPPLGDLAWRSLAINPAQRPQPSEWAAAIATVAPSASTVPTAATAPHAARPAPQRISVPSPTVTGDAAASRAPRRSRRGPLILAGALLAAVAAGVVVAAGLHHSHPVPAALGSANSGAPAGAGQDTGTDTGTGTGSGTGTGTGTGTDDGSSPQSQAAAVNRLLNASAASRRRLVTAVAQVSSCSQLPGDVTSLRRVAAERNRELAEASALTTDGLADGATLKSDLVTLLTNSLRADRDYVRWARIQLTSGCGASAASAPLQDAAAADGASTAAKQQFLGLWNEVAGQQGFPQRNAGNI